eukprot:168127_1
MNKGEHRWCIDTKLLQTMITAKCMEKFISPTFKMCHLVWQIEAYPNGNTPSSIGSFNIYLRLISIPSAWKNITICRTFKCNETQSGYTAVSQYDKTTSLGWPDFTLSLQDIKTRIHWLNPLQFMIQIKVLQIRLHKNDSQIFYEQKLDPYKALKHQSFSWAINRDLLHEMKQSYFRKGFVSPILNDMWCLRVYPAGKAVKSDFLIQLQLCGLPAQCDVLSTKWKIVCASVDVSVKWNTDFSYTQSCWGWGNNHLSFDAFKTCTEFTIELEVSVDTMDNIVAMSQWEKGVDARKNMNKRLRFDGAKHMAHEAEDKEEEEEEDLHKEAPKKGPPNMPKAKSIPADYHKRGQNKKKKVPVTQWIVNRLKIQDQMLDSLTSDLEETKQAIDKLRLSDDDDGLINKLVQIQKQVDVLSNVKDRNDAIFSEKERVKIWLRDKVKLAQYYDLFMEQGFDDLDCITHITKEDLVAMNIDKVGHQRKILNNAKNITM